jgi:4-hydroxybenzoate polyprenyltransferase
MSARDRLSRLVVVSRPRFWLYLAGPVAVGVVYGVTFGDGGRPADLFAPLPIALFAYFLLPANVFLYGVNDAFDADVDRVNPKKDGEYERRFRGDPVVALGVAVAAGLGIAVVAAAPPVARPWLVGFLALAVAYSAPPFRFKTSPGLDSVSNGLYVLPGAAAYAAVAGTHPPALAVAGGWVWSMAMHTFSAVPDIEPDREAGIRTTATVLGAGRTYAYCGLCWLVAAAAFAALDLRLGALLLVYPVAVAWIAWSDVAVERAYWWYPAINTAVGTVMTLGALVRLVPPSEVVG